MADPFSIVKDSSVWGTSGSMAAMNAMNTTLRVGVVKKAFSETATSEMRYIVEVQYFNDKIPLSCRLLRRFGGVFNYEDYVYGGYTYGDTPDAVNTPEAKAGDVVLVGQLNGQGREGIILGGIMHSARKSSLDVKDGPQYRSEFNGVETFINKDGEYTVTFKGLPTNIAVLKDAPSQELPAPTYDTKVGSSFYKFDKTGGWTVSDNSSNIQLINIDKASGVLNIKSGATSLVFSKGPESVVLTSKTADWTIADQMQTTTKSFLVSASTKAYIKSPKVAIGKEGVELLDQLAQLIDKLGTVTPISPVGPCTPLKATAQWPAVEAVKSKIKEITGSF
jgi:hypothetical protein